MRRRRSSNASSGMSSWNGRISVPVSTVAMPTSGSSVDSIGRGPSHYGDAANDPTTTLSESPLRVNDVHHISTDPGAHFRESSIPRFVSRREAVAPTDHRDETCVRAWRACQIDILSGVDTRGTDDVSGVDRL